MRSGGSSDIFVRSFPSRMSSSHTHCPGSSSPRNLANASSPSPDFDARQAATNFRVQTFARISSKTKRSTSRATAGSSPRCSRNSQRVVSCGDGDVELVQIQMPGAKRMNARDYLRGHGMETGIRLGTTEETDER